MITKKAVWLFILIAVFLGSCYRPGPGARSWQASDIEKETLFITPTNDTDINLSQPDEIVVFPVTTPTPNSPIALPTPRSEIVEYTVQRGDTLRGIGLLFQVSIEQIVILNEILNPNLIDVGQVLLIPPTSYDEIAPAFKIIPDSELVNSPSNADFDVQGFIFQQGGYLATYSETVDDQNLSGAEIVNRVALENSVNPRLLLAVLEHQSRWVTERAPGQETLNYPMGYFDFRMEGLYRQLGWAANLLNEGYYRWKQEAISVWILSDNTVVQVAPTINPGTAGVLNLLRHYATQSDWNHLISENGFFTLYFTFFGYPFDYAFEPMIPDDLTQPTLQLPCEPGEVWSYTGGPHGGWNSGSAWAALDFAPPGEPMGCVPSDAWVVASAPGQVVYSDHGAVIQELEGDGIWQTGWSILYMHIDARNRVPTGTYLEAGDHVGHPSCEGGFSTGTHLHIARRYNGEWIAADSDIPLVMDGWAAVSYGVEYNGQLVKGDRVLEALNGRSPLNAINR